MRALILVYILEKFVHAHVQNVPFEMSGSRQHLGSVAYQMIDMCANIY